MSMTTLICSSTEVSDDSSKSIVDLCYCGERQGHEWAPTSACLAPGPIMVKSSDTILVIFKKKIFQSMAVVLK